MCVRVCVEGCLVGSFPMADPLLSRKFYLLRPGNGLGGSVPTCRVLTLVLAGNSLYVRFQRQHSPSLPMQCKHTLCLGHECQLWGWGGCTVDGTTAKGGSGRKELTRQPSADNMSWEAWCSSHDYLSGGCIVLSTAHLLHCSCYCLFVSGV